MAVHVTRAGVALTVGIVVLTGLIIGGLYWVKETGEQARREDAIAIAERNLETQSENEGALNEGESTETPPAEEPEDTSTTIPGTGTDNGESADTDNSDVNQLPATGNEGLASFVAVTALSISIALYVQSRRQLQ